MLKSPIGVTIAMAVALSGCSLAPGPALDASRMNDDLSRPTDTAVYDVKLITPQLVYQLKESDEADAHARENGIQPGVPEKQTDYHVGFNDVLGITVWRHPELTLGGGGQSTTTDSSALQGMGVLGSAQTSQSAFATNGAGDLDAQGQRVAADGTIFFPSLGRVRVEGMSTVEISKSLYNKLKDRLKDPQIDVRVIQYRSQHVQVTGDIKSPGQLPLIGTPTRVVDAISRAGGANPDADLQRVLVSRGGRVTTIDVTRILNRGDMRQNIVLQAGDIVNVPDHTQNRVFVMGEVSKPQTLYMNQGQMSLADALTTAGSIDVNGANPRQIIVIRHPDPPLTQAANAQGALEEGFKKASYKPSMNKPEIFRLDMTQVDAIMLATEFDMKPLDVVYVGTAPAARFNRLLAQILPSAESFYLLWSVARN
ncbi:polysaccharide biosynthesis/export family protein [Paraburkholderia ginsengisoli]|uniref:Polysaccharide biosynthesis/export family protein n=1 Tax=Paraburkholderia ginsengisoli TaxID=311231 RepID=A0A7T4TBJ1_9BURK|nr:polysaccharide biosynthesis/export family protein [Paraburkholderia ginsengisoli]QQC67292.1 polysaccharide biosynthesis/export family protein [Paraburkholderia ginsengisoli]